MATEPDSGAGEQSPWTKPGFVVSAVLVGFIAVLGVVLVLTDPGGPATAPSVADKPSKLPAAPRSKQTAGGSVCGLAAGPPAVPSAAARTRWELVGRVAAPTAPRTIGPGVVTHGLRSCFARSAVGALYAAANVIAMTAGDAQRGAFVRDLVVDGIGRERALALLKGTPSAAGDPTTLQIAGFHLSDYRPRAALVDLALRADTGRGAGLVHVQLALRWADGDWKLAVPDSGDPFAAIARISSLEGYTAWSGA